MDMTIMNWVECPAVKPYAQCGLLVEAKNDVQKECENAEGNQTKGSWWNWKMTG